MKQSGLINLIPETSRNEWKASGLYPDTTVFSSFQQYVVQQPDKIAIFSSEGEMSYQEIYDESVRIAMGFEQSGIVSGDVIVSQLSNNWRSVVIDLAAASIGAIICPIPPGRGRLDIESVVKCCNARTIIVENHQGGIDVCEMIEAIRPLVLSLRHLILIGEPRTGWIEFEQLRESDPMTSFPVVSPDDPVRFLVSSGTESEPKLIAYSHNAILGGRGRFMLVLRNGAERFVPLYLVPLGSAFGSTASFCVIAWQGAAVVVLTKFSVDATLDAIGSFRPTHIFGVPTMFQRIAADPRLSLLDLTDLKALVCGGALIDEATINRCYEAFGCSFVNLYGSADGVNCFNKVTDARNKVAITVGKPNPEICDIKIVDDQHKVLPQGEVGEIIARGPISPMQYVNSPILDQTYRNQQGWVLTGDLGCIDCDGYLILMGRKKDIIIRGGANISPAQIEKIATQYLDIISAACIAVADPDLGQRVCLCLTLKSGSQPLSLTEITHFLSKHGLEKHKLPEYICHFSQLPLSPAGKVDKKALSALIGEINSSSSYLRHEPAI